MKKIILIIVSCIMLISLIVLPSSAESEGTTPAGYFVFAETHKAYPLYLSIDECVGFMEYYQSDDITFTFIPQDHPAISEEFKVVSSKNNGTVNVEMLLKDEQYGGEHQFISIDDNYDDFAFYFSQLYTGDYDRHLTDIALVGIKDGVKTVICEDLFMVFPTELNQPSFLFHQLELPEGYYIGDNDNGEETPEDTTPDTPTNTDRVYSSGFGLYINPNDIKDYNKQMVYDVPEWTVVPDDLTAEEMTKYGFIGKMFNMGEISANNCVFDFSLYNQDYTERLRITYSGTNYNIINVAVESDNVDSLGYGSTQLFNSFNTTCDFMIFRYDTDASDFTEYRYCVFDKTTGDVKSVSACNWTLLYTSIMPYNPYYEDNPSDHEDCIGYENGYNEGLKHANELEYSKGYAQGVADTKDGMHNGDYKYTEEDLRRYYDIGYLAGQDTNGIVNEGINGFFSALGGFFEPFMSIGVGSLTLYSCLGLLLITAVVVLLFKIARG